ncbi:uncharacterized protein MELLADRAFT_118047 [Melampsora larici-populina 98AG31]|uniref:Eukaryotic integral membrane protein n=1 Tax=Melampsora larici-populina (strain 98AG31 / pathotype 3-4-7) TaxID=747676 RepID=F4S4N1_MELLP|nr:uncharacterized protein MELLADRAFT_118047 [Melampsora larici-populina 98AG31]EGG00316.1 hypothetical protein MELLADRAFT_118047 [Melampsora larici-populina 98AG31]
MSGRFLTSSGPIGFVLQLPPGTKVLVALMVGLSTLIQLFRFSLSELDLKAVFRGRMDDSLAFPWLVMVPGSVLWNPWTILTAGLCEVGLVELFFSVMALSLCGRYLERVYGLVEFVKFCLVTIGVSNVLCVAVNVAEHYVLKDSGTFLYGMSYHGMMALQAGFLVAFTQLIPEHLVQLFGVIKIRVKNLPMLYVGLSNVMCLLGHQSPFILIQMGWLVSWYYLRFIKYNETGDFRGDRSATFDFASWFPGFVQPLIRRASDIIFSLAVKVGLLKPWSAPDIESGYVPVPGGARAEAERRSTSLYVPDVWCNIFPYRAMALKALDQRLASNKSTPAPHGTSSPDFSGVATQTSPNTTKSSASPTTTHAAVAMITAPQQAVVASQKDTSTEGSSAYPCDTYTIAVRCKSISSAFWFGIAIRLEFCKVFDNIP